MEVTFDFSLSTIWDVLSVSTAFMLGLLFITSKTNNRKANIFLALFLWSLSFEVLGALLFTISNSEIVLFQLFFFTIQFLFLYVFQTLNIKIKGFYFFFLLLGVFIGLFELGSLYDDLFNICILLSLLKTLRNHNKNLGVFYSDLENKTLAWIKTIIYIYLFFHSLWIIEEFLPELQLYFVWASDFLTFFMIYWIGYNGFSQSEIFSTLQFQAKEKSLTLDNTESISETKKQFDEMHEIILKAKLFTDTNLTIRTLSEHLNIKEKQVSKLINLHTTANFYHFINQLRIEEFKNLLSSSKAKTLSLLGLAEEAGFSSKSTFYAVFKSAEGITPKQYQLQLKKTE